ncbi:tetratricopeptide repeat protein 21B [Rhinichthys klamathensis goyatoka]|uniref:tetratricopeptide repeat protein 21B n=1 Tax=Rhinichthys klamathensis goyatoka TaxID=3034132 RepID=UPI0024B50ECC|nr:tetratricopeptide repeat protein 21B [Rhinichthys klamathensis goyatoka]
MREKCFRHAINIAVENLKLYSNDPVLRFFKAFATLMEGHIQEALRELVQLKDHPHLSLCSTVALMCAHKRCETIDRDAVNELNSDLKLSGSTAGDRALYYAALLYWILELNHKARTCIKRMLKLNDASPEGLILKGWIVLNSDTEENRHQAIRYFDSGVQDTGNLFGLMGKIEFFMAKQNEQCALDIANQIIVSHPDFSPALVVKMKVFMSLRDWHQTEDVARRVLERDGHDLKALQMMTVIAAAKDGNMEMVKERLQALMNAVEISEPSNPSLHLEITAPISRLVRDRFQFNLLKSRALLRSGDLKNAIQCLNITMNMAGVRRPSEGPQSSVTSSERVSVYLALTEALRLNGQQHEATKVLQDAILLFKGTPEETRVMLANVDLALGRDDVDAAVAILQNILPTESTYIQAREKMAHIYLERRRNQKLYIACYREISEQLPGPHTSILLADAFMNIHQPEEAVKIYQEVEKMAPEYTLAKKIGQALVKAHEYHKAVSYYETALKTDALDCCLSVELSELLLKLKRLEEAQQVLEKALEHQPTTALTTMMNDVKVLRLLVKVLRAKNESALDVVQKAHDIQKKVVCRVTNEHPAELEEERKLLSSICCDWAHEFHLKHDLEMAKLRYTDALNHSPDNEEILFHLAQLHYDHQKLDYSEELCVKILQLNHNHTAASMLLADTLFWKNQKEEAVKIYACIMERNPDNFHAMAKFLHILRRMGKLDDVQSVFKACEKFCLLSVREAGFNYCKGFYFWHTYHVTEALTHLNRARGDADWGEPAVELMVQICLNPDRDVLDEGPKDLSESENEMRLSTAQNLLSMFRPRCKSEQDKLRLLSNLCRIYSKEDKHVERAVLELTDTLSNNVMLEASLLAMAQGFLQLKQIPRARNFLKRLTRMEWTDANADHLENACLLLADMYIKLGKYNHVDKLLDSCIRHNKSCCKAYEYHGLMMENEQRYRDAALQYELAWKYSNRVDPAVGFRLAFNCLKCRNYTQAVDVCRQVLHQRPDYPQIHSEVLTRAQLSLRL